MKKILILACILSFVAVFPNAVQADHYTVSADDFKPGDGTSNMFIGYWGEFVRRNSTSGYLFAPVHLPSGAVVKNMRVHYYDNDPTWNLEIYFTHINNWVIDPTKSNYYDIFQVYTTGASPSIRHAVDSTHQTRAADRLIKNNNCTYWVAVNFPVAGESLRIYSIQFEY